MIPEARAECTAAVPRLHNHSKHQRRAGKKKKAQPVVLRFLIDCDFAALVVEHAQRRIPFFAQEKEQTNSGKVYQKEGKNLRLQRSLFNFGSTTDFFPESNFTCKSFLRLLFSVLKICSLKFRLFFSVATFLLIFFFAAFRSSCVSSASRKKKTKHLFQIRASPPLFSV
jgi:hypothetical protein